MDPTLGALLSEEIRRHAPALAEDKSPHDQKRALHSLKGSAGVAGERALFDALARIERRLVEGDETALEDARVVLAAATEALAAGKHFSCPPWPEPPLDLRGRPVSAEQKPRYAAEMMDRLGRINDSFAHAEPATAAIASIFREIHAMKAAALAAGDEVTGWFVHGLEDRTRGAERDEERARKALAEVEQYRGLLTEMVARPERAIEMLRRLSDQTVEPAAPVSIRMHAKVEAESELRPARASGDETLRVPSASLDRLLDQVRSLERSEQTVLRAGREIAALATQTRRIRSTLSASLSRARAASSEIATLSDALERQAATLLGIAERMGADATGAHEHLALLRMTTTETLFDRVIAGVMAQARRLGREIDVSVRGAETAIDRGIAEDLFDPILQVAQNAIVHGIEPADERVRRGKPPEGRIVLSAAQRGGVLVIDVADDGAGVDLARVLARAQARPGFSVPRSFSDQKAILGLLFVPGFSMRENVDMLAGRGVGLALVRESVRRLGGSVRLANRPGQGLTVSMEVPLSRGLLRVLWVRAGETTYALKAREVRRVRKGDEAANVLALPLATCVRGLRAIIAGEVLGDWDEPPYVLELDAGRVDDPPFFVAVDEVGELEDATLHAPPPLVAGLGPYNGAIVRGDAVALCIDVHALGELVHLVLGRRS